MRALRRHGRGVCALQGHGLRLPPVARGSRARGRVRLRQDRAAPRGRFQKRDGRDPDFESRLQTIKGFPVLILDDWGAHSDTPWADEQLYLILNFRTERVLPTVITTNVPLESLEPRIESRLRNRHLSTVIEIIAEDYRCQD